MKFGAAICLSGLLLASPSWGARPFVTDDARLATEGSCQLESWVRAYPDSQDIWALPACNPTGNLEVTLGGGQQRLGDGGHTEDYILQLKTLVKPLTPNGWGWGLSFGAVRHPEIAPGPNQLGNTYVNLPLSMSWHDDRLLVHVNLGWLRDYATNRRNMTWGLGGEVQLGSPRLRLIAETFGDDNSRPYWQTGLRYFLIPDLLQLDATAGQQVGGNDASRWLSFGLRWTPERLF